MFKSVFKIVRTFIGRTQRDHLGAYAATCAYFIMISFVPFFMIIFYLASNMGANIPELTKGFITILPSGLKAYVGSIINEILGKPYAYVPVSVLLLIWSAAKIFHALTNGLNVISEVQETRGWFYLRFRSMFFVLIFLMFVAFALMISIFGTSIQEWLEISDSVFRDIVWFFYKFRDWFAYFGLILAFLFIYKFLPNCNYTFSSQLPGALIVSTVWIFVSYLLSLYYDHNQNFNDVYGSITSMIMAMIWLYFCAFFLLVGAEINREIYNDPDDNVFVNTIDVVRVAREKKRRIILAELKEHSDDAAVEKEETTYLFEPKGIKINWADEEHAEEEKKKPDKEKKKSGQAKTKNAPSGKKRQRRNKKKK